MLRLFVNSPLSIFHTDKKRCKPNHFLPKIAPNIHCNKSQFLRLEQYRGKKHCRLIKWSWQSGCWMLSERFWYSWFLLPLSLAAGSPGGAQQIESHCLASIINANGVCVRMCVCMCVIGAVLIEV